MAKEKEIPTQGIAKESVYRTTTTILWNECLPHQCKPRHSACNTTTYFSHVQSCHVHGMQLGIRMVYVNESTPSSTLRTTLWQKMTSFLTDKENCSRNEGVLFVPRKKNNQERVIYFWELFYPKIHHFFGHNVQKYRAPW